jgi:hypothetical protein
MGISMNGAAGDPIPSNCELIEVRVGAVPNLFNAMDPSPFREKDLDPNAEEFIVSWARTAPREASLALLVHVDRPADLPQQAGELRAAVHEFFRYRAESSRRRLSQLLRTGRLSLTIGGLFLSAMILIGDLTAAALSGQRLGEILRESFLIGGWVAMWRPLEIFLYDWWPIRAEARLFDRLSAMPVRIKGNGGAA